MDHLVDYLKRIGVLKSPYLIRAFLDVDRADFVPQRLLARAYEDEPLPIGYDQTISQPYTVAFMLELLDPRPGETMLDIGAGSGWQTALLAHVACQRQRGRVYALERIPELCAFAQKNISRDEERAACVSVFCQNAESLGRALPSSFHKIICAAEVADVPEEWKTRLKTGGILVFPQDGGITKLTKNPDNTFTKHTFPGFAFVPFIQTTNSSPHVVAAAPTRSYSRMQAPRANHRRNAGNSARKTTDNGAARASMLRQQNIVFLGLGAAALLFYALIAPPADFPSGTIIHIKEGETLSEITRRLAEKRIVRLSPVLEFFARVSRNSAALQAGDYFFEEPVSALTVLRRLRANTASSRVRVTVVEGYTLKDIAKVFAERGFFSSAEFFAVTGLPATDLRESAGPAQVDFSPVSQFVAQKPARANLEGFLFPDTYFFTAGARPEDVISMMVRNFDRQMDQNVQREIAASGRNFYDVLIMASLLEKEASAFRDWQIVAGILWKRLDAGMPLQVDATLSYLNDKGSLQLSKEDLATDSPYNTYVVLGLPPTPIANPGIGAIRAAVRPIQTPYWYYLSDRGGNMHYGADFDAHRENKMRYLR
jgi:UPF0755 protein